MFFNIDLEVKKRKKNPGSEFPLRVVQLDGVA